ncbi:MAG: tetratricopeptide repeat protein [Gemmatimonadota bacterium]|jgi:TolB-like protein
MARFRSRLGFFFRELKRRKVYQVTAAYVVLAAAGMELVDILVPDTSLPEWSSPFLLALAIVGLPIVVVLAWTFDLTSDGVVRTERVEEKGPDPTTASESSEKSEPPSLPGDATTVAVLPFENLSGSDEAEPFVVGLHDDLLTELSRASALTVISRTSVLGYRGSGRPIREIARELGVGTVVEGGVQTAGNRVRLNVQVIDAGTDVHRWAERYDRELTTENIFELQSELAAQIMDALQAQLTSEEQGRVPLRPTEDLEAYRLYASGRSSLDTWDQEGMTAAARYFSEAVRRDPSYAQAWAGLADAVSALHWYNYPPVEGTPTSEEAVRRALELDPDLAEAHASRAIVLCSRRVKDAPEALREFQRAVELRPSYAYAQVWMSWVYLIVGDPEPARRYALRALELDPLSPAIRVFLSEAHLANGTYDLALKEAVRGREMQPEQPLSRTNEGIVLHHLGRFEEALVALERAGKKLSQNSTSPTQSQLHGVMSVAASGAGDSDRAREHLGQIDAEKDPFSFGLALAGLGDREAAFEALLQVKEWGQHSTESLRYFFPAELGPLRDDPRFTELVRRADRSWGVVAG